MAGHISVPFYANLKARQIEELIDIGDVKALFAGKLEDWDSVKNGIPSDIPLIAFPTYEGHSDIKEGIFWNSFINDHEPIQGTPSSDMEDT